MAKIKRPTPTPNGAPTRTNRADPRERLLADFTTLKVPLSAEQLDAVLARAERDRLTHLEFTQLLIAEQAQQRRERSIAARIREARCREPHTLAGFDWDFRVFRSLFSWITLLGNRDRGRHRAQPVFRSLFSWITLLGANLAGRGPGHERVSILVLLDHAPGPGARGGLADLRGVSILVLLDHAPGR